MAPLARVSNRRIGHVPSMRGQRIVCAVSTLFAMGLLLSACSNGSAVTQRQRLHREDVACKLIGTPPAVPPSSDTSFFVAGVPTSLVRALSKSDDAALIGVAQDLKVAARAEARGAGGAAIVRALDRGVSACQRLGISTVG